jgi:membrane fusion protein (multidrug efflux system)
MQAQRAENDEVSHVSHQLVGARGANAAQRARNLQLAPVASVVDRLQSRGPQTADTPAARRFGSPESPGTDLAGSAVSEPKVASRGRPRRLALIGAAAMIALATGGWYGYHWFTIGRFIVSTDDAYVRADATTLAAKVSGYVSAIRVANNATVHAGEVIARIDDGDYKLAVDAARDKAATQQAAIKRIGEQIPAAQASVEQAKAQLASAEAAAKRWNSELARQQKLAHSQFASQQVLEQTQASRDQAFANVQNAHAAVAGATANVSVLQAQQQEAQQQLRELKTAEAKAERDLSFTVMRAPIDGVIGNRAMQVGDYVQPGQRLASLVPLTGVYIDANFKETQLAHLKPGQPASVEVDALPDKTIDGIVASVSPASGSVFSLLPPDNATGNFTKIVQRLTVRIRLPASVTDQRLLRPGMSVVASVNTKPNAVVVGSTHWATADATPHWQAALR